MNDPAPAPPNYFDDFESRAKKLRAEKRRTKLLQNALKEARERRAREQSESSLSTSSGSRTVTPLRPKGVVTPISPPPRSPSPARPATELKQPRPPSASESKRPSSDPQDNRIKPADTPEIPKRKPGPDASDSSGDSMTSLIYDERSSSSPDDPTKMSISDIIRVKMMMKEKKKRVKKILTC